MNLSRSHNSSHVFCMSFFNINVFRVVLFVFDFSRCYANSFRFFFLGFIQMKFIFRKKNIHF